MSDEEEDSLSEGFSASEDEWKPSKDVRGGESSDDDDSEFEESPQAPGSQNASGGSGAAASRRKVAAAAKGAVKQTAIKKRKGAGQSLRTKLYNKYRPPPKTFPSPNSSFGGGGGGGDNSNSPSASTSKRKTASKNLKMPNESGVTPVVNDDSSSESSVDDYLVNPEDLDLQSSFFNIRNQAQKTKSNASTPPPTFDCNIGIGKLSDFGSEDNNESSAEEENEGGKGKSFDFANLLDNVNSLERAKATIAQRTANRTTKEDVKTTSNNKSCNTTAMDVNKLLALGEKQLHATTNTITSTSSSNRRSKIKNVRKGNEEEDDYDDECDFERGGPQRLSKTKSTRVKRHTKTRPASTIVAGDTDDSDFEEVAEDTASASYSTTHDDTNNALLNSNEGLEIHVDLPTKQRRNNKQKTKEDIESALKRKLNRDLKERFLHLHKVSLLCCFARSYRYNRMLNDTPLLNAALKLLPSSNAYPPERGTEIKYFQSMVTWYKTAVKLVSPNLYGEKVRKSRRRVKRELMEQIRRKEASCKQDFAFIFVILLRAMGLQCRLIVNMQPLPLRPAQTDLLTIKLKRESDLKSEEAAEAKKPKMESMKEEKVHEKRKGDVKEGKDREREHEKKVKERQRDELSDKKEASPRKTEGKEKLTTKDNNKSNTKEIEKQQSHALKAKVSKCSQNERRERAPSAKLAEMTAAQQKEAHAECGAKKARGDVNKAAQSGAKRIQAKPDAKKADKEIEKSDAKRAKEAVTNLNEEEEEAPTTSKRAALIAKKPTLSRLKTKTAADVAANTQDKPPAISPGKPCLSICAPTPIARRTRKASADKQQQQQAITEQTTTTTTTTKTKSDKPTIQVDATVLPKIVIQSGKTVQTGTNTNKRKNQPNIRGGEGAPKGARDSRSRSKSPKLHISPTFLQTTNYKNKFPEPSAAGGAKSKAKAKSPTPELVHISPEFLRQQNGAHETEPPPPPPDVVAGDGVSTRAAAAVRTLRSRQKPNGNGGTFVPQLDGADDSLEKVSAADKKRPKLENLRKKPHKRSESDEDFEPSPAKQPKKAPKPKEKAPKAKEKKPTDKVDRRVLSTDEDEKQGDSTVKRNNPTAADIWVEAWSDAEEQWICIDLYKGKLHSVEAIRKAASSSLAYVFAFQNDLSIKDVTARYCPNWTTTVRKSRVERAWLMDAFAPYQGRRTQRDIREDQELRRIHEEKPMPTAIGDYKDHPLYALERHLLKFQAIYPPNAPTLGFIRGEPVYARECVHTLHSREIWLKQARTVKLGEQPYKIVKARPKWDRLTQTVIKDQPLEIFGYWQTEDYEPPTAENGLVPRNAYGNVELFKECMLPKKTVHLRLPGLNRICKKLGIDCAQAVTGFDFHQGGCHPLYDGFVVCEEFGDQVTAAWYQDQEEQEKKEQDKYEARVYGNWKKLIKGLLIRERLKKKYNF